MSPQSRGPNCLVILLAIPGFIYDPDRILHLTVDVHDYESNYETAVTITASDPEGLSASLVIPFTVYNVPSADDPSCVRQLLFEALLGPPSWPVDKAIIPFTLLRREAAGRHTPTVSRRRCRA